MDRKIEKRIYELFNRGHVDDDICSIGIKQEILDNLLPYQVLHTFNMINALKNNRVVVDGSYTGTGKTYTSIAACAQLNLTPFIICPKSVINKWNEICAIFGVNNIGVVNYETIRVSKYINPDGDKITCPYISKGDKDNFIWDFDLIGGPKHNNIVIIFDEVHKCKNHRSLNGKLLLAAKKYRTIMISATLCDKNTDFGIFGMMLDFYKNYRQGKGWINSVIRESRNRWGKASRNVLQEYLYPSKGSRMSLEDLGEAFPMNQISIDCYTLDKEYTSMINKYYKVITNEELGNNRLVIITTMRQKIENLKTHIILDLFEDYYDKGKSIVIFVNYVSTFDLIAAHLNNKNIPFCSIHGKQTLEERDTEINRFQNNTVRVTLSMIQAGGTSISLHDETGLFPRISIISPSYSSIELVQTLGRIYRSNTKSPCLQRIVYCAGTLEEDIAQVIRKKKDFLTNITNEKIPIVTTNV